MGTKNKKKEKNKKKLKRKTRFTALYFITVAQERPGVLSPAQQLLAMTE